MGTEEAVVVGRARRERIQARKASRKAAKLNARVAAAQIAGISHTGQHVGGAGSRKQRDAEKKKARKAQKSKKKRDAEPREQQQEEEEPHNLQPHAEQQAQRRSRKRSREGSLASQNVSTGSASVAAQAFPAQPKDGGRDRSTRAADVRVAPLCTTLFYDGCDDEISAATAAALAESGVIGDETLVWSEHPAFDFPGYTAWEECSYVFGVGDPPEPESTSAPAQLEEAGAPAQKKAKTEPFDAAANQVQLVTKYPYPVDDADHCETPAEAYADAAPILHSLARQLGKTAAELKIWDPYFCQGSVKRHLADLGFTNVYNECEDFYARLSAHDFPEHDVLLTNPPYSSDHLQKIIRHVTASGKPWLLLVPNFVYVKEYYRSATRRVASVPSRAVAPFYIVPHERYYYYSPKGLSIMGANGQVRKSGETKTSPFLTFWYIGGLGIDGTDIAVRDWNTETSKGPEDGTRAQLRCKLAQSMAALPQHAMDKSDPNRIRLNRTEREKLRKKTSKSGAPLCKQCGQEWGNCRHTRKAIPLT